MSPTMAARSLHNREPAPGLINLPIPLPSIPVLTPLLNPIISGQKPANPQPASPVAPSATQSPPKPTPTQSNGGGTSGGNSGNSGSSGNSGNAGNGGATSGNNGNSGNSGNSGGNSGNSGGNSGNSGNSGGTVGTGNTGNAGGNASGNAGTSPSGGTSNGSTSSPAESNQGSGQPVQNGSVPESSSVSSAANSANTSSTSGVSGVSASGVKNVGGVPTDDDTSSVSENPGSQAVSGGSVTILNDGTTVTRAAVQPSGSSKASIPGSGSDSVTGGGATSGTSSNSGSVGSSNPASPASGSPGSSKSSGLSGGAIGGIVVALLLVSGVILLLVLRRRYRNRRKERQLEWMSGFVNPNAASNGSSPEVSQRASVRSSWGTPIERPLSAGNGWISPLPRIHENPGSYDQHDITPGLAVTVYDEPPPPMRTVSPTRSRSPEDPFTSPEDQFTSLPAPPRPVKQMNTLPIRISLISTGSEVQSQDPFDDVYVTTPPAQVTNFNQSRISAATFGQGKGFNISHADFPMPPSTACSTQTTFINGNNPPVEYLHTPTKPVFPDSPVSPTFASSSASASYRRASVKHPFQPSEERRDEVHVEKGDQVSVVSVYEDGWAFVQREKDNERGLVPLSCLEVGTAV